MGIPVGTSCASLIADLSTVVLSVYLLFLPNNAVDWSLVYDCGISWSYSLIFLFCFIVGETTRFTRWISFAPVFCFIYC